MKSTSKHTQIGIVDFTCYVPQKIMTAEELAKLSNIPIQAIHEKLGMHQKCIAEDNEGPIDLAIKAVEKLFASPANQSFKNDIDFIIYASSGFYDYQLWSPSAKIQQLIGNSRCFTFELNNGCNSINTALFMAKNLLQSNPQYKYGLIVTSDTVSKLVNYKDPKTLPFMKCGDAAAALLIQKDCSKNKIISSSLRTNGQYADCCYVNLGGAKNYPDPGVKSPQEAYINFNIEDELTKNFLSNAITANFIDVINIAIDQANINLDDIKYFLFIQNTKTFLDTAIDLLKISPKRILFTGEQYGHLSGVDSLLGLELCYEQNLINSGDYVLLAATGIGYHWGATVLQV